MKRSFKPGEPPPSGDIQPREVTGGVETETRERQRRKAVDRELAKERPDDERVEGLTGKYIA